MEQTRDSVHDDQTVELHPNMAELYRKKVKELQSLLVGQIGPGPLKRALARPLNDGVDFFLGKASVVTERSHEH